MEIVVFTPKLVVASISRSSLFHDGQSYEGEEKLVVTCSNLQASAELGVLLGPFQKNMLQVLMAQLI